MQISKISNSIILKEELYLNIASWLRFYFWIFDLLLKRQNSTMKDLTTLVLSHVFQIGSFFMINLCLVVIATQFSETKKRETERMMQERKRFQSSSTLASNSEPGGCYAEILKYLAHLWRRAKRKVLKAYYNARGKTHKNRKVKPELSLRRKRHKGTCSSCTHKRPHSRSSCPSCRYNYYYQLISANENLYTQPDEFRHNSVRNLRRNSSPLAPRASPEMSDLESISSPRRSNFLTVPNSLHPASLDSLHSLSVSSTSDNLSSSLPKYRGSSNHLAAPSSHASISRASSFNSSSRRHLPSLPESLATHPATQHGSCHKLAAHSMLHVDSGSHVRIRHASTRSGE